MPAVGTRDNPAERLMQIMRTLREQPAQQSIESGWRKALGLDQAAEFSDVLRGFAATRELPAQVLAELHRDPDAATQETFTSWVDPINAALKAVTNFAGQLDPCTSAYDAAAITSLGAVSYVLHRMNARTRADDDSMHALLEQLLNLEGDVSAGDFDENLKAVLLEQLAQMQHLIRLFRVRGTGALRDAACLGAGAVLAAAQKDQTARPTLEKIWAFVTHLSVVAQMGESSLAIAGQVAQMIH